MAPVARSYLLALLLAVVLTFGGFFAFTWTVDPYGVSPIHIDSSRFNQRKPKRLDIDRLIKPFEVWRYQPRTVFLGSSRIHQSLDPAVLDGSPHAPAYNASVPAVSLGMNRSYLRQYVALDGNLETAVVELFIYNFLGQGQDDAARDWREFIANFATLQLSADAFWASVVTVWHNIRGLPNAEIAPGGFYRYPPGHDAKGLFDAFPAGMWALYKSADGGYRLHEPAFTAVQEIIDIGRANGVEVVFFATPNHAYFDYFIDKVDAWDIVEEWLNRLTAMTTVYSFSQPNELVYEEVGHTMKYWNDPFHFSLAMGEAMLSSFLGKPVEGLPSNFMSVLTPDGVHAHVEARRQAVRQWAASHSDYLQALDDERIKAGF